MFAIVAAIFFGLALLLNLLKMGLTSPFGGSTLLLAGLLCLALHMAGVGSSVNLSRRR
jgi:glucose dehydrogenase